jgi:hypothetical protein
MVAIQSTSYSKYAPLRYEITRPFCKKISAFIKKELFLRDSDTAASNYSKELWGTLGKSIEINIHRMPFALSELRSAEAYSFFLESNRIIYDFNKKLVSSLIHTDADNISLKGIKFPTPSFYIHFGDIDWPESSPTNFEGAYVRKENFPECELITITPIKSRKFTSMWVLDSNMEFEVSSFNICVDDEIKSLADYLIDESRSFRETLDEMREFSGDDNMAKFTGHDKLDARTNYEIARIVVNCLLFLNAVPEDADQAWDDRAPRELVLKAESADKEGARKSALNSLEKKDYVKVKLIGKRYDQQNQIANKSGSKQVSHIRRGHFRNQAYGPEWSMHRVVFIPPALINPGTGDLPGRILDV